MPEVGHEAFSNLYNIYFIALYIFPPEKLFRLFFLLSSELQTVCEVK